jgi:dihydroxyacetone kinase-like predicted kinase
MRPPEDQRRELAERYRIADGTVVRRLTEAGLTWLRTNQQIVNSLNVFPVPDGDTGTNMTLTMQSAIDALHDSDEPSAGKVAKMLAHGALMGARGNSGVILSQLWRGLARAVDEDTEAFEAVHDGRLVRVRFAQVRCISPHPRGSESTPVPS